MAMYMATFRHCGAVELELRQPKAMNQTARCHVRMGPGSPFSHAIRDPFMHIGTPLLQYTLKNNVYTLPGTIISKNVTKCMHFKFKVNCYPYIFHACCATTPCMRHSKPSYESPKTYTCRRQPLHHSSKHEDRWLLICFTSRNKSSGCLY